VPFGFLPAGKLVCEDLDLLAFPDKVMGENADIRLDLDRLGIIALVPVIPGAIARLISLSAFQEFLSLHL